MCIACFSCHKKEDDSEETPDLLKDYRIVYSSDAQYSKESSHAINLQKQIKTKYGLELSIDTDSLEQGGTYDSESKEILVGHTKYSESQSAAEKVTRLDHLVTKNGNKIILIAGGAEALGEAVSYFLENYIESVDGEIKLKNIEEHLELYEYAHEETSARIMSLNLRNANSVTMNNQSFREPRIVDFVRTNMPDSIGVQECESFWFKRLKATIGTLGYVPVQEEAYAGGDYAFKNFIWYNPNTVKLVDSGRMWLSETPDTPSKGFGAAHYISMGWAILENKETGAKYVHVNTHLSSENEELRDRELDVLLPKIESFKAQGYKVFVTGDFNFEMTSPIYTQMIENLRDARKTAKETTELYTFSGYSREGVDIPQNKYKCIDYCFYTEDTNVFIEKFDVIDKWKGGYMSDHNALVIDVTLYKR